MPTLDVIKTGEVWDARLSPTMGGEQSGIRPALIISNDEFNEIRNDLCLIVPITGTDRGFTFQYKIHGREAGLSKNSIIMCDQVRAISPLRFLQIRGCVSERTLANVRGLVARFLENYPPYRAR